jgi:hypothetical protein
MKARSTAGLGLTLGLWMGLTAVHADDFDWRPTSAPPSVARVQATAPQTPAVTLETPIVVRPQPAAQVTVKLGAPTPVKLGAPTPVEDIQPITYTTSLPLYRAQAPDSVPPPPAGGGAVPPPPLGGVPGGDPYANGAVSSTAPNGNFFSQGYGYCKDAFTRHCGQGFESDNRNDFKEFCSPVTSPFLSVDPRSLTEVKPLFIYQSIPGSNPLTHGGSVEFFGLTASLALSEKVSIVLNKFGGVAIQPDDKTFIKDQSAFSEIWIGPKFTFYRDELNKAVGAVGLMFQIPTGSDKTFQNTGDLTLVPYFSFAKGFGKLPMQLGNFNYMSTTGIAIATDSQRADYFYSNFHLDFDVLGQNRLYPLVELNWMRYFNKGNANPVPFEGGDLFNIGARDLNKKNIASLAFGARYKLGGCDNIQFGGAFEFPLSSYHNLNDFRVVFDVIFRY